MQASGRERTTPCDRDAWLLAALSTLRGNRGVRIAGCKAAKAAALINFGRGDSMLARQAIQVVRSTAVPIAHCCFSMLARLLDPSKTNGNRNACRILEQLISAQLSADSEQEMQR